MAWARALSLHELLKYGSRGAVIRPTVREPSGKSTVKVPDDEAAKASLQGVLKSALRPPGAWSNLVDGAELEEHLNAVLESDEATRLLVEVLQAAVTADMKSQVEAVPLCFESSSFILSVIAPCVTVRAVCRTLVQSI